MSTKYLLNFIEALPSSAAGHNHHHHHHANGVTGRGRHAPQRFARAKPDDLRQLLLDAKEGLEIKNTTHEFFETLERITNELRGMTEHSTAFLSKVRKADAPDYYNVIKHPMDLGTILKKVKAQAYKDKKAFKADLELIWDNCFIYNTLAEHPLRRSATILRNRANHLLEFVTDPTAAPAPTLHRVPGASRMHAYRSRLDALDASHVISSTAGNLIRSARHPSEGAHSVLSGSVDYEDAADESGGPERLEREASSEFDDSDFQDLEEEEEEDESIRTRKGVTSLKTQPGGGRNLELLRGLAAPGPEDADAASSALSIYPSGLDLDTSRSLEPAGRDDSQRALSASPSKGGTPSPAPASQALPEAPGTVPGQGAALLARRATAATHPHRRPKPRTTSLPPPAIAIPFPDRPALLRTPEAMARFAHFAGSLAGDGSGAASSATEAYLSAVPAPRHTLDPLDSTIEASPSILPLLPFASSSKASTPSEPHPKIEESAPAYGPLHHVHPKRAKSSALPMQTVHDESLLWWQGVTADALFRNGLPDLPFCGSGSHAEPARPLPRKSKKDAYKAREGMKADLARFRRIKRLHRRLAVLNRTDDDYAAGDVREDFSGSDSEDGPFSSGKQSEDDMRIDAPADQRDSMGELSSLPGFAALDTARSASRTVLSPTANQRVISGFCGIMLEHAGFDSVSRTALDAVSHLLVQYFSRCGESLALYRDRFAEQLPFGTMLRRTLDDVALSDGEPLDSMAALAHYVGEDLPSQSQRMQSLSERLASAYDAQVEAAEAGRPVYQLDEGDIGTEWEPDEASNIPATITRIAMEAEYDHYALHALGIDRESPNFDLRFLHSSLLRSLYPSSPNTDPPPFSSPPAHVPLAPPQSVAASTSFPSPAADESSIASQIGLLQPYLVARRGTDYGLFDDDALPESGGVDVAKRARKVVQSRPDVPVATGKVTLGKRKRDPTVVNAPATMQAGGTTSSGAATAGAMAKQGSQLGTSGSAKKAKTVPGQGTGTGT